MVDRTSLQTIIYDAILIALTRRGFLYLALPITPCALTFPSLETSCKPLRRRELVYLKLWFEKNEKPKFQKFGENFGYFRKPHIFSQQFSWRRFWRSFTWIRKIFTLADFSILRRNILTIWCFCSFICRKNVALATLQLGRRLVPQNV